MSLPLTTSWINICLPRHGIFIFLAINKLPQCRVSFFLVSKSMPLWIILYSVVCFACLMMFLSFDGGRLRLVFWVGDLLFLMLLPCESSSAPGWTASSRSNLISSRLTVCSVQRFILVMQITEYAITLKWSEVEFIILAVHWTEKVWMTPEIETLN